jgi:flagellar biogenesis protein FliO
MTDFSVIGTLVKVVATFGLLFLTLKMVGRFYGTGRIGGSTRVRPGAVARPVEVVGRTTLGRNSTVTVVRMGDKCFALGVTEQSVSLLTEVDIDLTPPPAPTTQPPAGTQVVETRPSWRELVESLREKTVRH